MKLCEIIITVLLLAIVAMGVWGFFILNDKLSYLESNITDIQVCLE